MSPNTPLVSIVVPSYNQGQFIEDTLLSILNQTYVNIEVLVMDGGSKDSTLEVLERYADRIRYVSERDHGQSDAINKGFRQAQGDIITWLNSDDVYPDRRAVARMVEAFERHPDADLVYGDFIEIDANNRVLRLLARPGFSLKRLMRIGYISQPATFFRRRVVERMPVREDLSFALDLEYWLRAHQLGFRYCHIPYLIAAERVHDDAKCVASQPAMEREARQVRESFGAVFGRLSKAHRFVDRLMLYACRLAGSHQLFQYLTPTHLTIRLDFSSALVGTVGLRKK